MTSDVVGTEAYGWQMFMRKHWRAVAVCAAVAILLVAWAVWVFLWFVGLAQSSHLVPSRLAFWTMANLLNFILNAIFWELVLVGIPVVVAAIAGWMWWKRLPYDERVGYHFSRGRGRSAGGGGGVGLLFFIAFLIKVYLDGNWDVAIGAYSVDYVVGSFVTILEWFAVIFGIPAAIALIWWLRRETRKVPAPVAS